MDEQVQLSRPGRTRWYQTRWLRAVGGVLLLVAALAGGVLWGEQRAVRKTRDLRPEATRGSSPGAAMSGTSESGRTAPVGGTASPSPEEPVEVTLSPEMVERARIKIGVVGSEVATATLTVPGTVVSNAYRDTKVHALVGGIVRDVTVELGATVRPGQALAVIFSSELADAQMKYLAAQAMLAADHQKRVRTQQLVALGAASRQELEDVTAVHAAHETEVAAARQRLLLLGLSADRVGQLTDAAQVVSEVSVTSPGPGTVIARSVNPGQVVNAGQELFVVTDLGTVWVLGDLYEKDLPAVGIGKEVTVMVPALPQSPVRGRVAYIEPRVDPATRTTKVRIEVPNRNNQLRLSMFVSVVLQMAGGARRAVVPKGAVQAIGDRMVAYVPAEGDDTRFIERTVKIGPTTGELLAVLDGLKPGERVVTEGSFFLRAEATRARGGG